MQTMRAALLALLLSSVAVASGAHAQQPERVALFKTANEDGTLADLASALDPVVQSALGEVSSVTIAARAAIDLPSLQLAIDCVGETADCLRAAAAQSEAESLLAPSVSRQADDIIVAFLHFNPTLTSPVRSVERRYTGERQGEAALAGVRGMLTELFGTTPVPAPAKPEPATPEAKSDQVPGPQLTAASSDPPDAAGLPILPIVLGGVGVALIGTGITFGLMSVASLDDYKATRPSEAMSYAKAGGIVNEAKEHFATADDQATIANLMYGLGAGVLVGAGVLFFWQMKERPSDSAVSLQPRFGTRHVGLTLTAAWDDDL